METLENNYLRRYDWLVTKIVERTRFRFIKKFKVKFVKNMIYMYLLMAGFWCATILPNKYIFASMGIYFAYFVLITLIFNLKEIKNIKLILFNR